MILDIMKLHVCFFINYLKIPDKLANKLNIIIELTRGKIPRDVMGRCDKKSKYKYTVLIDSTVMFENQISTLAHELVHVYQYVSGRLNEKNDTWFWLKKKYKKIEYDLSGWEIEAKFHEKELREAILLGGLLTMNQYAVHGFELGEDNA